LKHKDIHTRWKWWSYYCNFKCSL